MTKISYSPYLYFVKVFEKNSNIFRLLSEGVSEGILVVNKDKVIVAANGSAHEMFGYEKTSLIGKNLNLLIPTEYRKAHDGHVKQFLAKSSKRRMGNGLNLRGLKKCGESFPLEVGLNPFELYGNTYIMALIIDITERRQHEEKIKAMNEELESKIKLRTKELEESVSELRAEIKLRKEAEERAKEALEREKELNELKTKFLSLVSHEFKTPLSTILTSTTLLSKYKETEQQPKRDKHLNTIRNKVKYLDGILNDFLSVERLESGKVKYNLTDFPLSKLVNQVVYDANMLLKKGQHIRYPDNIDGIELQFDEKILELVIANLLHNAIKYSPENTSIEIEISEKKKKLLIKVTDHGMGIPEEDQKFIFDRYFRAANALLTQGTGIGLNIAKRHMENLGGTITFESKENKGTEFVVHIPR
ncbi:PAS domain-containing sensor histidine kinase [Poritiphilus flavus]|uniref:histidine kinase n=1 Tax=Poritiphilus flavus TaxID=2697053 RepID=A0A6L9EBH7_9FLAO|nr:PAS domain-containing sensor histidine kinase [Poritiphilus flavus]NAS11921.1 PAS domain S-box protein [Poritiphilus flavus]